MTNKLVVRNVEARIVKALQEAAARHGRSVEDEHREILRAALQPTRGSFKEILSGMPDVGTDDDFNCRNFEQTIHGTK